MSFTYKLISFFQSNQDNGGSTVGLLASTLEGRNVYMRVVLASERKPLPKQMQYELLLKKRNQQPSFSCARRVYIRGGHGAGVDSGKISRFSFGVGCRVKNLWKMDSGPLVFGNSRSLRGLFYTCRFISKNIAEFRLHRWYPESEQQSDAQIWKIFRPGFKNVRTGAESVSNNVTTATSAFQKGPQFEIA